MKRIVTLIIALTILICQARSQDIRRLEAVSMPIATSMDFSTKKPVGDNLVLRLSVVESQGVKTLIFLIFDNETKKTYVEYAVSNAVVTLNNKPTQKDQLSGKSELALILPKDSQSNAVFFFKQYFKDNTAFGMRVAQFDPLTNHETMVFMVKPSLELFHDSPQGDPYYPILSVLQRAYNEGLIESIQDITDQQ